MLGMDAYTCRRVKKICFQGGWLAQTMEYATLNLRVVPHIGCRVYLEINSLKIKEEGLSTKHT